MRAERHFRATDRKVELLSTLLLHNLGGKCRSARKILPSGKQALVSADNAREIPQQLMKRKYFNYLQEIKWIKRCFYAAFMNYTQIGFFCNFVSIFTPKFWKFSPWYCPLSRKHGDCDITGVKLGYDVHAVNH